jgi:hypothetical protein
MCGDLSELSQHVSTTGTLPWIFRFAPVGGLAQNLSGAETMKRAPRFSGKIIIILTSKSLLEEKLDFLVAHNRRVISGGTGKVKSASRERQVTISVNGLASSGAGSPDSKSRFRARLLDD